MVPKTSWYETFIASFTIWWTVMELDLYCVNLYFSFIVWVQEKGAVAMEDSKNLFKVKNDLRSVTQSYCMEFYFQIDDNGSQQGTWFHSNTLCLEETAFFCFMIRYLTDAAGFGDWNSGSHDLQLCFGVKDFLVQFLLEIVCALPHIQCLIDYYCIF